MTKVIQMAGPRPSNSVHTCAPSPNHTPAQQAAIENALSMALYFVRQSGDSEANLWAATARTNRALTLLKHASEGIGATRMKTAFYAAVGGAPGNTEGGI